MRHEILRLPDDPGATLEDVLSSYIDDTGGQGARPFIEDLDKAGYVIVPKKPPQHAKLYAFLLDWWRGYTAADVENARAKLSTPYRAGEIIWMSKGEMRAMQELA